jgi:hypothetical protein
MSAPERHLQWFLRATALMFLSAAIAVFLPYSWMNAISEWQELGELPRSPLVEYLTRSMSALYAVMGSSYWFLSCDVRRYLPLLRFTVPVTAVFDVAVIALDLWIPMPLTWTIGEAVSIVGWTAALWWLLRRVED